MEQLTMKSFIKLSPQKSQQFNPADREFHWRLSRLPLGASADSWRCAKNMRCDITAVVLFAYASIKMIKLEYAVYYYQRVYRSP